MYCLLEGPAYQIVPPALLWDTRHWPRKTTPPNFVSTPHQHPFNCKPAWSVAGVSKQLSCRPSTIALCLSFGRRAIPRPEGARSASGARPAGQSRVHFFLTLPRPHPNHTTPIIRSISTATSQLLRPLTLVYKAHIHELRRPLRLSSTFLGPRIAQYGTRAAPRTSAPIQFQSLLDLARRGPRTSPSTP